MYASEVVVKVEAIAYTTLELAVYFRYNGCVIKLPKYWITELVSSTGREKAFCPTRTNE